MSMLMVSSKMVLLQSIFISTILAVVSCGSYQSVRFIRNKNSPGSLRPSLPEQPSRTSRSYYHPGGVDWSEVEFFSAVQNLWNSKSSFNTLQPIYKPSLLSSFSSSTGPISSYSGPPLEATVNFLGHVHYSPDYSNGLDNPDPLLLTGLQAKRAAAYLYRKELFFDDIPHMRAILWLQQQRKLNGLAGNKLGSIRRSSPWYRGSKTFY